MLLRLLLLAPLAVFAQSDLAAEWQKQYDSWYWQSPRTKVESPQWSEDGKTLAFGWNEPAGMSWRLVDCVTGQIRPAFDTPKLIADLSSLTGKKFTAKSWPFERVIPMADGSLRLESAKESWSLDTAGKLADSKLAARKAPPALNSGSRTVSSGRNGTTSPDGAARVELREGNVILKPLKPDAAEIALTKDGVDGKDAFIGPIIWSPDGKHFALWRERKANVRRYTVVDSLKGTKKDIDYDKPGDERTERTPWVFSVASRSGAAPGTEVLPKAYATERLDWSADGTVLRSEYIRRGFTGHGIIEYDTRKRAWRKLLAEEDPKFVYSFNTRYRHDLSEDRTLWISERTGWLHLYSVDLRTGLTTHPVTSGRWVMKQVLHLDAAIGYAFVSALGRNPGENPYHQHVCRVSLDGKSIADLTPSDGHHEVTFSPDRRTLIDVASRVDLPHHYTLRSALDGRAIATLGTGDTTALKKAGWTPAMPFVAKDRDGKFDIWGVVTRPHPFDPKKKYPVIENIYAGPHGSFAPRSFNWWHGNHRELSMRGFYVVQMDGRGTNNRGKEFHQVSWRNLKDGGFPDRIAWMKSLAKTEPNMDLGRVGIFGGSAGGQNTAHAVLLHGDFYKAGAADCGCYDNRVDKLWWNEQWLGYPIGPWYEENSCARYAANLRGRLFLSVGESDTNVDVKCSYDFRDALLAAGKKDQIEFHVVPGANHGAGESKEMRSKRALFFESTLGKPIPL